MSNLGTYCKAYQLKQMEKFSLWAIADNEFSKDLNGETVVYLHDTYAVTSDIFPDTNILFDDDSSDWRHFCQKELKFVIPIQTSEVEKI